MASLKIVKTITTPAFTRRETRTRNGQTLISVARTLQKSFYGTLATRATANTGTIVLSTESHGITPSSYVDLYFSNGTTCLRAGVVSVNGEVITVNTADSLIASVIPASIGINMAVAIPVTFDFLAADIADISVLAYGLRYSRSFATNPTTAYLVLTDGGEPYFQTFAMTPPDGVLWDKDSLNYVENDLVTQFTQMANVVSGQISNPSYSSSASFRLSALIDANS